MKAHCSCWTKDCKHTMTCAKCGYMLGPFDKECARCEGGTPGKAPSDVSPANPVPQVALVLCPACQQQVSSQAIACPKCGQPIAQQPIPQIQGPTVALAGNGSGTGTTAVLPAELNGFSWGAFWLSWVWAIANNTWIGLLALIPYVGVIMWFVLGAKGNEWAWQNRRWESVEEFRKVQSTWAKSGLITFIVITVLASVIQFITISSLYGH